MEETEIFFAAIALDSATARDSFLCEAASGRKRKMLDDLLLLHDSFESSIVVPNDGSVEKPSDEKADTRLDFLNASDLTNSLGRLDQYEIVRVVQSDAAYVVLEGYDTKLSRIVFICALNPQLRWSPPARERFQRVATAASSISSSHVIRVFEGGEQNEVLYVVMEASLGRTLQRRLEEDGPCSASETLRMAQEATQGLAAIHDAGLIHRSIHPGSIFLSGAEEKVKIRIKMVDQNRDQNSDDALSPEHQADGFAAFMPPEQVRGEQLDERSDLFSLGVVFHTMSSGTSPFAASTVPQSRHRIGQDIPQSIRETDPDLPIWLDDLVSRLLSKNPGQRLQSAADVLERFREAPAVPKRKEPSPQVSYAQRSPRRWRRRIWRTFDWAVRVWALCIVLASIAVVHKEKSRGMMLPPMGPFFAAFRGNGLLDVVVDNPDVQLVVKGLKSRSWRGPVRFPMPPGNYHLVAYYEGYPILRKRFFIGRWEKVNLDINTEEALVSILAKDPDGLAASWLLHRGGIVRGFWHDNTQYTDPVRSVQQLPIGRCYLESVELRNLTPADFAVACRLLNSCPRLKILRVRDSELSGQSLRHAARIGFLEALHLTHLFDANEDDFLALAALPSLRKLSLNYSPHAQAFCSAVGELPQLREVEISDCPVTDAMLKMLCQGTDFDSVTVHSRFLTDASLVHFEKMESLSQLELRSPLLTGSVWEKLAKLEKLQSVKVGSFPAGADQRPWSHSQEMIPNLRELVLADVVLDDRLATRLSEMPRLEVLQFEDSITKVESLKKLTSSPELKVLRFIGTSPPQDDLATLRNQLPDCEVSFRADASIRR